MKATGFLKIGANLLVVSALSACGGGGVNSSGSLPPPTGGNGSSPGNGGTGTPPDNGGTGTPPDDGGTGTPPENGGAGTPPEDGGTGYGTPVDPPAGFVVTPSSQQPMRSANDTAEYRSNYTAKEYIHDLYALDNGWDGHGVDIGVIDDGVNTANTTEFNGQISDKSKDFGSVTKADGTTVARNDLGDDYSDHGTPVAGIIAAAKDGQGVMGIAPGAKLVVLRIDDTDERTKSHSYMHATEALHYAAEQKLKVVNMSLTLQGNDMSMASAVQELGANGGLLINAAGNDAAPNPTDAFLVTGGNRDAWLFVGALNTTGTGYTLASYSNKAGSMADRYVVAMGDNVTVQKDGSIAAFSGTSSAAPEVAGLAALILSKWPQLSGKDAGNIILATAKDLGDPGVDPVYGHGLVDAQAALSPVDPVISNGARTASIANAVAIVPTSMSPASLKKAVSDITVIDKFGRNYSGSLAAAVIQPEGRDGTWLRRRVAMTQNGGETTMALGGLSGSFGFANYVTGPRDSDRFAKMTAGSFDYVSGSWSFNAGVNSAESMQTDIMGLAPFSDAVLAYASVADTSFGAKRIVGGLRFGMTVSSGSYGGTNASAASLSVERGNTMIRASFIRERGSVLGSPSEGGLALGRGANTTVIEARHMVALGYTGWNIEGYGSVGITKPDIARDSLITGASSLLGTRLGIQASGAVFGGLLSLGVAQPLTIERGTAHLTLATGYDYDTMSLIYSQRNASLASDQRRMQLTAGFASGGPNGTLRFGIAQGAGYADSRATLAYGARF